MCSRYSLTSPPEAVRAYFGYRDAPNYPARFNVAPTQEVASAIASVTRHQALHLPIPEWSGLITGMACPYNPAYLERGAVYRFCVNHVVEPDDPFEMFPTEYVNVQ